MNFNVNGNVLLGLLFKASVSLTSSLGGQLIKSFTFITKYTEIFDEKIREAFAMQKLLTFFDKNIGIFEILTFKILMKR